MGWFFVGWLLYFRKEKGADLLSAPFFIGFIYFVLPGLEIANYLAALAGKLNSISKAVFSASLGFIGLATAISGVFLLINNWDNMDTLERVIGVLGTLAAAAFGAALAIGAFHSAWSLGLAAAGIAAGIAAITWAVSSAQKKAEQVIAYANGGYIPRKPGTLAMVGENGRTELMANLHSGGTAVANIDQIEEAQYRAFTRFARDNKGYFKSDYSNITIEMDRQKVGQLVAKPSYSEMRRTNIIRK